MPTGESTQPISWADQVEAGDHRSIPLPEEILEGDLKKLIEYKREEDGKLVKIVRTYKIEKRKASKTIAHRKTWMKFGNASQDGSGPSPQTTTISDDVYMQFITNKEEMNNAQEEDQLTKLKQQRIVMCRVCKGDHWTTKCPYKDSLEPLQKELLQGGGTAGGAGTGSDTETDGAAAKPEQGKTAAGSGKYVPPGARAGAKGRGETMSSRRDEGATIRVTNLSEDTREYDLQELFRPFGAIQRIYLAMDKNTGQSKGFAFINFYNRESAARAIAGVSGFGYDHLILKVEWAKPSGQH